MKEINLTNKIGDKINNPKLAEEDLKIAKYYIGEDLKLLFGKEIFDSEEIDTMLTPNNIMELSTIFNDNIYYIKYDENEICCYDQNKNSVFYIYLGNETIENKVWYAEDGVNHQSTYTFTKGNNVEASYVTSENDIISFAGKLTELGVKLSSNDIFELNVIYPKQLPKSDSFIKRLIENLSTNNFESIRTSMDHLDISDYIDELFTRLKKAQVKYTREETDEKKLKKDNN